MLVTLGRDRCSVSARSLLAHAVARREQSQAYELAVVSARIAQAPLHGLPMKVEQPSQGMKGLQGRRIDLAVLRHRWYRGMICETRHVPLSSPFRSSTNLC